MSELNHILPVMVDLAALSACVSVIGAPFVTLFVLWRKGLFKKR